MSPAEPKEPRTEAGKALHDALIGLGADNDEGEGLHDILAIEEQAATEAQCPYCPHTVVGHDDNDCGAQDCQCENPIAAATEATAEADLRLLVMTTARDAAVKEADRLREAATEARQRPKCPACGWTHERRGDICPK